jgi:hypothetical protein
MELLFSYSRHYNAGNVCFHALGISLTAIMFSMFEKTLVFDLYRQLKAHLKIFLASPL